MTPSFSTLPVDGRFGGQTTLLEWLGTRLAALLNAQDDRLDARLAATDPGCDGTPFAPSRFVPMQKAD